MCCQDLPKHAKQEFVPLHGIFLKIFLREVDLHKKRQYRIIQIAHISWYISGKRVDPIKFEVAQGHNNLVLRFSDKI